MPRITQQNQRRVAVAVLYIALVGLIIRRERPPQLRQNVVWHRGIEVMLEVVVHIRPKKLDQRMRHDRPRIGPFAAFSDVVIFHHAAQD